MSKRKIRITTCGILNSFGYNGFRTPGVVELTEMQIMFLKGQGVSFQELESKKSKQEKKESPKPTQVKETKPEDPKPVVKIEPKKEDEKQDKKEPADNTDKKDLSKDSKS